MRGRPNKSSIGGRWAWYRLLAWALLFGCTGGSSEGFANPDSGSKALPNPLTLADAKLWADQASPGIMAAAQRVSRAWAAVAAARSTFMPQVYLDAGVTHFDGKETDLVGGTGARLEDSFYSSEVGARLDWVLFSGMSRYFNLVSARMERAVSEASYQDVRRLLMQSVAFSYHSALLAEANAAIARQDAEFNRQLSDETRKRFDAGAASRSDILNFDIRVARAQVELLRAENSLRTARTVLSELLGLPEAEFPVDIGFAATPTDLSGVTVPSLADSLGRARALRPDLAASEAGVLQLEAAVRAARGQYLPQVSLQAGYSERRDRNLAAGNSDAQGNYIGLAGTWQLFDGGARRADVRQLLAQAEEARMRHRELNLAVASEVRQKIDAATVAREEALLQSDIQEMTLKVRNLVRAEYRAGTATLTRLNEVQTDLVRANGVLALATIGFWQAMEDLDAAVGDNLPD